MKVPLHTLKPGDFFWLGNIKHIRVENQGEANAIDIKLRAHVVLPYTQMVDIPPFAPDDHIEQAEIEEAAAQAKEDKAKGVTIFDKIRNDLHPLDEEE